MESKQQEIFVFGLGAEIYKDAKVLNTYMLASMQ
jgi:hypothetical protein